MKPFFIVFFASLLFHSFLSAEIIETNDIRDIKSHIDENTLIIFDIDNTLLEPIQDLGNDQWFQYRVNEFLEQGCPKQRAIDLVVHEWAAVQNVSDVQVIQENTDLFIQELQKKGYTVMGLTTRGLGVATRTIHQLESLNISLITTSPTREEVFFQNKRGVLYRGGILFTANTHKGRALFTFLDNIEYNPKKIVFINDKHDNLTPVEEYCETRKVPFVGLRFGYLDDKVANFDPEISKIQQKFFGHILSDEHAMQILAQEKKEASIKS